MNYQNTPQAEGDAQIPAAEPAAPEQMAAAPDAGVQQAQPALTYEPESFEEILPDACELARLSQTYGVELQQPAANEGGISFGGGAQNAFVREFAEKPQYERTLEEIEREERSIAEGYVDPVRRERLRNEFRVRSANSVHIDGTADPDWRIGGVENSQRVAQTGAGYPTGDLPFNSMYVQPLSDESPVQQVPGQQIPLQQDPYAPAPAVLPPLPPESGLNRLISQNTGFSVFTIVTAAINLLWAILYIVTCTARGMEFSSAERAMALQNQLNYTLTFQSPLLGPLKFFMYLLPLLAVAWAIAFKVTDSKGSAYNKKTVIVFLCIVAFSMLITVFDIASLHLLG